MSHLLGMDLLKDEMEHPIPDGLRPLLKKIAEAFAAGDFQLASVGGVEPVDPASARLFEVNVHAYGEPLARLDDATWEWSVYRWMDGYWQVLVDLSTSSEPVSDLAVHARIYEADYPRLKIESVHVP